MPREPRLDGTGDGCAHMTSGRFRRGPRVAPQRPRVPCAAGPLSEETLLRGSERAVRRRSQPHVPSPACLWQPRKSSARATRRRRHMRCERWRARRRT